MSAPLRQYLESMHYLEREELETYRSFEVDRIAEKFGVDTDSVRKELKRLKPETGAERDRHAWMQAVVITPEIGVRAVRVAWALYSLSGSNGYVWPSQKGRLLSRSGYSDDAEIRKGIRALVSIGALRVLKVRDLPVDLAKVAMRSQEKGGSGRSPRGSAYLRIPPSEWVKKASPVHGVPHDTGTRCTSIDTITQTQCASHKKDFIHDSGDSLLTTESVDSLLHSGMERISIGGSSK